MNIDISVNLPEQICKVVGHDLEIISVRNDPVNLCVKTDKRCKRCNYFVKEIRDYTSYYFDQIPWSA